MNMKIQPESKQAATIAVSIYAFEFTFPYFSLAKAKEINKIYSLLTEKFSYFDLLARYGKSETASE